MYEVIIVGGGAAGFYAAIHIAEQNPKLKIAILERGKTILSKVKVSGGGRCNVTHGEFLPKALVVNYPRGQKELLGPFHQHSPLDVMAFFKQRGVPLKIEEDGRVFPQSDSSQTIIDCFESEANKLGVKVLRNTSMVGLRKDGDFWLIETRNTTYKAKRLMLATGSNPKIWNLLKAIGHTVIPPVPSLFTFNIDDDRIRDIQGISTYASAKVLPKESPKPGSPLKSLSKESPKLQAEGPVLITHWGLSGPVILKLSAWGALILKQYDYKFNVEINWMPDYTTSSMEGYLREIKKTEAKRTILRTHAMDLPRRLWVKLVHAAGIGNDLKWADTNKEQLQKLAEQLTASTFKVDGKSTFKEEFVTAGGIDLKEINFKTFESKLHSNLFFAGEIINVDAITGGFNFQNAWTGAYIAAKAIASKNT
ncbi:aminoacetone oxidase family FAD-binding enzyme [Muricauda sp. JGD-17]|uniref:Aminoacetone oxidase family FAD-binding enzyme n=1 Tax=Flagellimonas ochracea TaxID=2696472 RepID=A0A964TC00_9FLAO|nr:NAD(P)/FAD-dependent oxidoreductase [Allomuricauda ochracea]NAY92070.1 aminoacetone oxidase family FAD-binding enzyme [Allomuricauda ochracea]